MDVKGVHLVKLATAAELDEVETPGKGDSVHSSYSKVPPQRGPLKGGFDNHVVIGFL